MFLNFLKLLTNQNQLKSVCCTAFFVFIASVFLSFQITTPLKAILNDPQTNLFLEEILTQSDNIVISQIANQEDEQKQLFYSLLHKAAISLKEANVLNTLSPEKFHLLLEKALFVQQILFVFIFSLLFIGLFYIAYFFLCLIGSSFYQPTSNKFWANILCLPFCLCLYLYITGIYFNTLLSPLLLLMLSVLISLFLAVYLKKHP